MWEGFRKDSCGKLSDPAELAYIHIKPSVHHVLVMWSSMDNNVFLIQSNAGEKPDCEPEPENSACVKDFPKNSGLEQQACLRPA